MYIYILMIQDAEISRGAKVVVYIQHIPPQQQQTNKAYLTAITRIYTTSIKSQRDKRDWEGRQKQSNENAANLPPPASSPVLLWDAGESRSISSRIYNSLITLPIDNTGSTLGRIKWRE